MGPATSIYMDRQKEFLDRRGDSEKAASLRRRNSSKGLVLKGWRTIRRNTADNQKQNLCTQQLFVQFLRTDSVSPPPPFNLSPSSARIPRPAECLCSCENLSHCAECLRPNQVNIVDPPRFSLERELQNIPDLVFGRNRESAALSHRNHIILLSP